MKHLVLISVLIILFSCQSKEQDEVSALLEAVFESELSRGDSIYLVQEGVLDWGGNASNETCDLEWMEKFFMNPRFEDFDISKIYSEKDAERVCQESKQPYKYRAEKIHPLIRLIPKERIDAMKQAYNETGGIEIEIRDEMDKFRYYETLSKPVFTKNYEFAILYKQSVCYPDPCLGPVLTIYKKIDGKWAALIGMNFYLI